MDNHSFLLNFNQVDKNDVGLVGGKGANLGEMIQKGFPIPNGFIVTAPAYFHVLDFNQLQPVIKTILKDLNHHDPQQLESASRKIKKAILEARIPSNLALEIIKAYLKLGHNSPTALVAVRSSATAEDLPDASFAGQQETYLNVKGEANVIQKVRACWASLFEPRAIFYRQEKGFDHFKVGIAVPVQTMVQSQVSGIMFTINPVTNDKNQIVIEAIWGLGEKIVQGAYTPDHYLVQKNSWQILQKQTNRQLKQLVWHQDKNREIKVKKTYRDKPKLTNEQIIALAELGQKIQQHYFFPQDIEWAMTDNQLYLVQSRPVTTINLDKKPKTLILDTKKLPLILKGEPASPGMAIGYPRVLKSAKEIKNIQPGEILITDMTTPDFVPAMKKAVAIITNKGGQTSHAAIVSRELGIPCIVGTQTATQVLNKKQVITVNAQTGEIFKGGQLSTYSKKIKPPKSPDKPKKLTKTQVAADFQPTATKVYVNLGEPELADSVALKNVDGVGLLRAEFMIAQMGIHPKKLIHDNKQSQFVDHLVKGLTTFGKAFYPRPVIYRATDFKTNEYANLVGGKDFEPAEPNPMLGYRGAFRYIKDQAVFNLELKALKIARDKHRFTNLWLMIPFVRTVDQLTKVKKIVSENGLIRSSTFKLFMMAEIPSNVVLLENFIKVGIDGVSIGSNDLTMLMLGLDRDNSEVAPIYDERNPAVLWALKTIITTCQKHRIACSICGQAPSTYPELTQKLIEWGITSVSVSPDVIDHTRQIVYFAEQKVLHNGKNKKT